MGGGPRQRGAAQLEVELGGSAGACVGLCADPYLGLGYGVVWAHMYIGLPNLGQELGAAQQHDHLHPAPGYAGLADAAES